jgi:hypothetical protein
MRVLVCASICALVAGASLIASADTASAGGHAQWCYRDIGAAQSRCEFPSARQCLAFAGIAGGICERSSAVPERKPARRQRNATRDHWRD